MAWLCYCIGLSNQILSAKVGAMDIISAIHTHNHWSLSGSLTTSGNQLRSRQHRRGRGWITTPADWTQPAALVPVSAKSVRNFIFCGILRIGIVLSMVRGCDVTTVWQCALVACVPETGSVFCLGCMLCYWVTKAAKYSRVCTPYSEYSVKEN